MAIFRPERARRRVARRGRGQQPGGHERTEEPDRTPAAKSKPCHEVSLLAESHRHKRIFTGLAA
jgi:hypothetical protein